MLSIDNPPPADPPCPPQLNSPLKSSNGDERDSSSGKLVEKVDLSQSALDDKNTNNPPSYFSIRDYVFSSRSKNIKTNWPFSPKCLQVCLEHGVKDLLPPFQSVDNLRKHPVKTKERVVDTQDIIVSHGDDDSLPATCQNTESANINSSGTEGDKVYPSATTSQSFSEFDFVPGSRSSCLESGKAGGPIKPPPVKKCSLLAAQSTEEDNRASNFAVSESMASKTCPVCKIFSSSSNTTLNAHIDQCLSSESTVKWTSNCEVIKNRMKPRKTRLMRDIYATAPYCTLEDLDRRNGTTFASRPSIPAQDVDGCADDHNNEKLSPINIDKTCDQGAVYIDANGTKLRILSKFNDEHATCSKVLRESAPKKFITGDKGSSKFLSIKKKKHKSHAQKYQKILKLAAHSKNVCSPSPHISEMHSAKERSFVRKQSIEKEERLTQEPRFQESNKIRELGTIRQSTCSNRTGIVREMRSLDDELHEHPGNLYAKRSCALRNPNSSETPACFLKSHQRLEDVQCDSSDDHSEQPFLKKRVGVPLPDSQVSHGNNRSTVLKKRKAKHLKADDHRPSAHHSGGATTKNINQTASPRNSLVDDDDVDDDDDDDFTFNCKSSTYSHHAKGKRFSSLRKKMLFVGQASVSESRLKKSGVPCILTSDEETVIRGSEDDQQYDFAENQNEFQAIQDESFDRSVAKKAKFLRTRKQESKKDEIKDTMGSYSTSGKNNSSTFSVGCVSAGKSDDIARDYDHLETHSKENEMEPASVSTAGRNFLNFSKHQAPGINSFIGPPELHAADRQLFGEGFERPFISGQEMFSGTDVGKTTVAPDLHVVTDMESSEFQEYCHLEVESIPIPGPPGSFLPSPGRMPSEDLQGNSSLASSRLQSSYDSPVSAISTLSNFTLARSDSRSPEKSAGNPWLYAAMEDNKSSLSNGSIDHVVENLTDMKINVSLPKKGFRFTSDQPCCCARKECASQSSSLSYQESQLFQRRTAPHPSSSPPILETNLQLYNHTNVPRTDGESASPSASKPVLRLMGKNVLVDSIDESVSPQEKPSQTSFTSEANMQFSALPGIQCGDFHHADSPGSLVSPSARFNNFAQNLGSLHSPMFSGCGLTGFFGGHEPFLGEHKMDAQTRYCPKTSLSRSSSFAHHHSQNAGSSSTREIIVINDSPEGEANAAAVPGGISVPPGYNPNCRDVYGNNRHESSSYTGSGVAGVNVQWNRSLMSPSSSSSSTGHLRSSKCYTPGFS